MHIAAEHPGFREHASGLIVPADLSRVREVCTKDELKAVERGLAILRRHAVLVQLACPVKGCKGHAIERIAGPGGDVILRCEHRDLVFTSAF